jgi:hypothetical protein
MELSGENGDNFEVSLIRYQFANGSTNERDASWLMVRTRAALAGHEWSSDDPAMLPWEVDYQVNWPESLGNNREVSPLLDLVEPNLRFQVDHSACSRTSPLLGRRI